MATSSGKKCFQKVSPIVGIKSCYGVHAECTTDLPYIDLHLRIPSIAQEFCNFAFPDLFYKTNIPELTSVKKNQTAFSRMLEEVHQSQDSGFEDIKSMVSTLLSQKRGTSSPASSPRKDSDDGVTLPTTSARTDVISRQAHDLFVKNCGLNSASGALKKVFPDGSPTMSKSVWVSKIAATRRASFWQHIASQNSQDHLDDPEEIVEEILNCLATPEPNASSPTKSPKTRA